MQQRQQCLRQPGEIPTGDRRLLIVGVPAVAVDGAEDGVRTVVIHEGTGSVVDRLAGEGHVVGVHDAVDKADVQPPRDQGGLSLNHRFEEIEVSPIRLQQLREMPRHGVVGQRAQGVQVIMRRGVLEGPDADVAGGDAGQHRPGQDFLAHDLLARRGDRKAAGGRDAERVHRLADDILPQHRPESGPAIPAARIRRAARAFQLDIEGPSRGIKVLA